MSSGQQDDQVRLLAYQLWQERGCPWGTPETDWFRAEEMLMHSDEGALSAVARQVGSAIGATAAFLHELRPTG